MDASDSSMLKRVDKKRATSDGRSPDLHKSNSSNLGVLGKDMKLAESPDQGLTDIPIGDIKIHHIMSNSGITPSFKVDPISAASAGSQELLKKNEDISITKIGQDDTFDEVQSRRHQIYGSEEEDHGSRESKKNELKSNKQSTKVLTKKSSFKGLDQLDNLQKPPKKLQNITKISKQFEKGSQGSFQSIKNQQINHIQAINNIHMVNNQTNRQMVSVKLLDKVNLDLVPKVEPLTTSLRKNRQDQDLKCIGIGQVPKQNSAENARELSMSSKRKGKRPKTVVAYQVYPDKEDVTLTPGLKDSKGDDSVKVNTININNDDNQQSPLESSPQIIEITPAQKYQTGIDEQGNTTVMKVQIQTPSTILDMGGEFQFQNETIQCSVTKSAQSIISPVMFQGKSIEIINKTQGKAIGNQIMTTEQDTLETSGELLLVRKKKLSAQHPRGHKFRNKKFMSSKAATRNTGRNQTLPSQVKTNLNRRFEVQMLAANIRKFGISKVRDSVFE